MNIALIGATGFVGDAVLVELLDRNHLVTALVRDPARLAARARLKPCELDVYDTAALATAIRGHDAVVSAFNPGWDEPELYALFMRGSRSIERAAEAAGVKRLLVVGGAGSLFVAPGVQLVDTPGFKDHVPGNIIPGSLAARDALAILRDNTILEWTFLSPPAALRPGERSGSYRCGGEDLLMDDGQPAGITVADLAVALVDEIENPRHVRARFTVASSL